MKIRATAAACLLAGFSVSASASPSEWGGQVGPLWLDSGTSVVHSFAQHGNSRGGYFLNDPFLDTDQISIRIAPSAVAAPISVQLTAPVQTTFTPQRAPQLNKAAVVFMGETTPTPPVSASATDDGTDGTDGSDGTDGAAPQPVTPIPVVTAPVAETDDGMMAAVPGPAPILLLLLGLVGLAARRSR